MGLVFILADPTLANEMKVPLRCLERAVNETDCDFGECQGPEEDPIPPPAEPPPLNPGWVAVSEDET